MAKNRPLELRGLVRPPGARAHRRGWLVIGVALLATTPYPVIGQNATAVDRATSGETTVYENGRVFTAAQDGSMATAFTVRDGKFVVVGNERDVRGYLKRGAKRVDLAGHFVIPGLGDDHFHGEGGGPGLDLSKVRTMADLLAAVRAAAASAPDGGLVVSNFDWHEAQLAEQRLPTATELDSAAPNTPVVLPRGGHSLILNSAALAKFGITSATKSPPGGVIGVDSSGHLTGEIVDAAKALVPLPRPKPMTPQDLVATQRAMNAFGVTSVRIPGFYTKGALTDMYRLARQLVEAKALTLRYTIYLPGPGFGGAPDNWPAASGLHQDDGDDWVRIGGVKLGVDGGFEGAHLSKPYAEPYGRGGEYSGTIVTPAPKFDQQVLSLARDGWRVATHAAGDAAIDEVLDGYEAADAQFPIRGRRWTIEHAFIVNPAQIERMKKLDIMLSLQDHLYLAGPSLIKYWGAERARHVTPVRTLLKTGLLLAGGTDAPVVPANPFWAMYHFLSRNTIQGGVMGADERVKDRGAVLRMFTVNYARMIGADRVLGSIEAGKHADFALLSDNFLSVPLAGIRDMKVISTYVDGIQVYSAKNE